MEYIFTFSYWLYSNIQSKRSLILQTLLKLGAEVDSKNDKGETPLMLAMQKDEVEYVEILMTYGADISQTTTAGKTALERAQE